MSDEIISQDVLKDIFYGSFPSSISWDCIDDLYIAIHTGAIMYSYESIASVQYYHQLVDQDIPCEGLGPQGPGHAALKRIGQEWFQRVKQLPSLNEPYFCGFHPDILSSNHTYVLECGTTDAGCVEVYLMHPDVEVAGNIAYPFDEDTDIRVYLFSRGPLFYDWQTKKVSRLREVFRKTRK